MLVLAPAAAGDIAAFRFDAVRGGGQDPIKAPPDKFFSDVRDVGHNLIAVNGERHKDNPPLETPHAVSTEGHAIHAQFDLISRFQLQPPVGFLYTAFKIAELLGRVHQNHFPLQPNGKEIGIMTI
jgi:hypothetical protein